MIALATKLEALQADLIAYSFESAAAQTNNPVLWPMDEAPLSSNRGAESQALPSRSFEREGDYWTLGYDGSSVRIKDSKGLKLIRHLLAHPGQRFHTVELELVSAKALGSLTNPIDSDLGPVLDSQAKKCYRARLSELQTELAEARHREDQNRASELEQEASFFTQELARAVGLGGRDIIMRSEVERARLRVTNSIRLAISRVSRLHAALGHHLRKNVITSNF